MKAGQLFENAIKEANVELSPGAELKVQVKGKGRNLRLVVNNAKLTPLESIILERSRHADSSAKEYNPKLSPGERIRAIRQASDLTLAALAKKAGLSRGSLCSIESGTRPLGLAVAKRIADALGVDYRNLI